MVHRRSMYWRLGPVIALLSLATSCTDSAGPARPARPATVSAISSPFRVGHEPDGYRLIDAGRGTQSARWGEDSTGTDEPFTVLAPPDDTADSDDAVVVSVTGFEGYEGGLAQASAEHSYGPVESFEVDGRRALYVPAGRTPDGDRWADLVAIRGRDLAVRVTARHATRSDLVEILRRVRPSANHEQAPNVPDPPRGLRVVGSVNADAVVALTAYVLGEAGQGPGPLDGYAAGWKRGQAGIAVMALPGQAADLAAISGIVRFFPAAPAVVRRPRVGSKDAVAVDLAWRREDGVTIRTVASRGRSGDLLIVTAQGLSLPPLRSLIDVAASVRTGDDRTWGRLVNRANGGPGLAPDPGAVELDRGRADGFDWLLQAVPLDRAHWMASAVKPGGTMPAGLVADVCLKLSATERVCADSAASISATGDFLQYRRPPPSAGGSPFPAFGVLNTGTEGVAVRVPATGTLDSRLHKVPGARRWAAVVFADLTGVAPCVDGSPGPTPHEAKVEVLDDAASVVRCVP